MDTPHADMEQFIGLSSTWFTSPSTARIIDTRLVGMDADGHFFHDIALLLPMRRQRVIRLVAHVCTPCVHIGVCVQWLPLQNVNGGQQGWPAFYCCITRFFLPTNLEKSRRKTKGT